MKTILLLLISSVAFCQPGDPGPDPDTIKLNKPTPSNIVLIGKFWHSYYMPSFPSVKILNRKRRK